MQTSRGYKIVEILQTSYMNGPRGGGFILRQGGPLHIAAHGLSRSVGRSVQEGKRDPMSQQSQHWCLSEATKRSRLDEGSGREEVGALWHSANVRNKRAFNLCLQSRTRQEGNALKRNLYCNLYFWSPCASVLFQKQGNVETCSVMVQILMSI